jgi:hypothetical protein
MRQLHLQSLYGRLCLHLTSPLPGSPLLVVPKPILLALALNTRDALDELMHLLHLLRLHLNAFIQSSEALAPLLGQLLASQLLGFEAVAQGPEALLPLGLRLHLNAFIQGSEALPETLLPLGLLARCLEGGC